MRFTSARLGDLGVIVGGGTPGTSMPGYWGGDIPWVTPKDLSSLRGRYVTGGERAITADGLANSAARVIPAGSVLLSSRAPIGLVGIAAVPLSTNQGCRSFVPGPLVDPEYAYYRFLTMSEDFIARASGSTFMEISGSALADVPFYFPPLREQKAIAEVLGALDDKIAANTALAATADELMHQTFRGLTADSEVSLSNAADFVNGKAFTKGASGTGRVVVRIAELNGGISGSTVHSDAEVDDKHVARPGDILFAWSGSLTLHRWFRPEAIVNQHIFKVVPQRGYPTWLVYELLRRKLADFKAIAADKATTMGHIQRHHLDEIVGLPSTSDIERLDPLMSALWGSALNAEQESLTLAATRDALLPQLMSGKLRVRDAENVLVEAGA